MNIAKILKDKPQGTKLYSITWGKCELVEIRACIKPILVRYEADGAQSSYTSKGTYSEDMDECLLFPSKAMRDWSKFRWEIGDILVSNDGKTALLFYSWCNDDYTKFVGAYGITEDGIAKMGNLLANTCDYIRCKRVGDVKLHLDTAEKTADVKPNIEEIKITVGKPKYEFKPFDKVLVRDSDGEQWYCDLFSHMDESFYVCIGCHWRQCLPYNEETAKLIGTTKSLEDVKQ